MLIFSCKCIIFGWNLNIDCTFDVGFHLLLNGFPTNRNFIFLEHWLRIYFIMIYDVCDHNVILFLCKFNRSARSLSRSHTPTAGTFLVQRMSPTSHHSGISIEQPLLGGQVSTQSVPSPNTKTMLCLVRLCSHS